MIDGCIKHYTDTDIFLLWRTKRPTTRIYSRRLIDCN